MILRYTLYAFILFAIVYSEVNIFSQLIINLVLIIISEKLILSAYKNMWILIHILLFINSITSLTNYFYTVFEPNMVYALMLKFYDFTGLFYLLAVQLTFISFWARNKEIRFEIPLITSLIIYLSTLYIPNSKFLLFLFVNSFGVVTFFFAITFLKKDYLHISSKKLVLSSLYFIYSLLILIDFINDYQNFYESYQVSYTYPLMMILSLIFYQSSEEWLQKITNRSSIIIMTLILVAISILQADYQTAIIQNVVFMFLILVYYKLILWYRNRLLSKYGF